MSRVGEEVAQHTREGTCLNPRVTAAESGFRQLWHSTFSRHGATVPLLWRIFGSWEGEGKLQ